MAVRSQRTFGPIVVGPSATAALYDVPEGRTWRAQSLLLAHLSGVAGVIRLEIYPPGIGPWTMFWRGGVSTNVSLALSLPIVLNPGDAIRAVNESATQTVHITGFGSLLLGAPA